jgi:hypothetical protein
VVCVWDEGLPHTVNMDAMLKCVSVSVGHVGASVPVLMDFCRGILAFWVMRGCLGVMGWID